MKKIICLFVILSFFENTFCQDVLINGSTTYRLLTWDDFSGKPDKDSPFQANTYWGINYSFNGVDFAGDTAKFKNLAVTLKFDETKSWVKEGKQIPYLLKHEQGHFDIGLICQKEIIKAINNTVFFKADFREKLRTIFTDTMKKYHLMQLQYDEETDHSKNEANQQKWNDFIAKALQQ
jgi:Bacterial protein of unknown function (DUF922)